MPLVSRFSALLLAGLLLISGCHDDDGNGPGSGPREFWGTVSSSPALVSLRFEGKQEGAQIITAYITDGFPGGVSEFFRGAISRGSFSLGSSSGGAQIDGRMVAGPLIEGTLRLADGRQRSFSVEPVTSGGGRYDVRIAADGRWSGTGPDASTLEARQEGDFVNGAITTRSGQRHEYRLHDLSRVLPYGATGNRPDRYTLFVSPRGLSQVGRGGAADGAPSENFVNLDLPLSPELLPGIYFGRLRFQTDLLLVDINEPAVSGNPRSVRVYVSDGEPEPEGDIAWFQGDFAGDSFQLTAAGGGATIDASVTAGGVSGTVSYGAGPALPFFAGPAGEGAGVYDVVVDANARIRGNSEEGGSIDFRIEGSRVTGTLTTPAGTAIAVDVIDLVRSLRYPGFEQIATVPENYVAFLAPHARYVVGRSGSVRTGLPRSEVIGIDRHE